MANLRCEFCKHGAVPTRCAATGSVTWMARRLAASCGQAATLFEPNPDKADEIERWENFGVQPKREVDVEPKESRVRSGPAPRELDENGRPLVLSNSYRDQQFKPGDAQRRNTGGARHGQTGWDFTLAADHPAATEGRTRYPAAVGRIAYPPLKSGYQNTKIGKTVTKGPWAGMQIFTLSLEERATCPRTCENWLDCYGNKMPFNARFEPGRRLEAEVGYQLADLQARHLEGFVVRLHVLGDFYSAAYVDRWAAWLAMFPALHVFGYTAWGPETAIGAPLYRLMKQEPRFRLRFSNRREWTEDSTVTIDRADQAPPNAIICPAQTGKSDCCSTCALCWGTRRPIAFLKH